MNEKQWINTIMMSAVIFIIGCAALSKIKVPSNPLVNAPTTIDAQLFKAQQDVNGLKQQISGDMANIKATMDKMVEANTEIYSKINSNIDSKIQASMRANLQAIAGFQNQISDLKNTAGRDITQNTNDSKLMKYIIEALAGLCMALIVGMLACLKTLIQRDKEKRFYKEKALLRVNTEDDLSQLRQEHDSYIKGNKGGKR